VTGLGFAGLGWLGQSLLEELPKFPELQLAAVQDVRPELAAATAARTGSPWSGTDYAALLRQPGVDAVVICTPNALHVPQARQALEAGRAALVQKPLALSGADARHLVALAQQTQRLLFVDYTYRFLDTITCLERTLQRTAGRITSVRATFHNIYGPGSEKAWFFEPRLSGGGALVDLGVHLLDLALALTHPHHVALDSAKLEPAKLESAKLEPAKLEPGAAGVTEVIGDAGVTEVADAGDAGAADAARVAGAAGVAGVAGVPGGAGVAGVDSAAALRLRLDEVPFELAVSWGATLPQTEISFEVETPGGRLRWENVDGSFFHFRTLQAGQVLLDRETTLREDTLRAFAAALRSGHAPAIDVRVYDLLDQAYRRG